MNLRWSFAPLVILCLAACTIDLGSLTRVEPLVESRVRGDAGPKLVMLEIEGVITDFEKRSRLGSTRPSPVARAREALELAARDDKVAGLVLRIQSPGGTVAASETLYHELMMWKQETNLPVVAYMQGIAASGGYYVAMAADRVIAHPSTVTGSIGVIMTGVNVSALMQRFGVEDQTLKSGEFKDAGSPLRPMRDEERAQLQSVIDDFHGSFIEVVDSGRPELDGVTVRVLADGRIFSAKQALEAGLIDQIAHLDEALDEAQKMAGIPESQVVVYHRASEYQNNIYSRTPSTSVPMVDIDVLTFANDRLPTGFYYLWPPAIDVP